MKHAIQSCVLVMAVAVLFPDNVVAQSLNYSDAVTVPQVDSKMNSWDGTPQNLPQQLPNQGQQHAGLIYTDGVNNWILDESGNSIAIDKDGRIIGNDKGGAISASENNNADNARTFLADHEGKTWVAVQETKETGETCTTYIEPIQMGDDKPKNSDVIMRKESEKCMDTHEPEIPYETFVDAVMSTKEVFAGGSVEINLLVLKGKHDGKYYVGYKSWYTDTDVAKISAPSGRWLYVKDEKRIEFINKFDIVASVHNHPDMRDAKWDELYKRFGKQIDQYKEAFLAFMASSCEWFSNLDAISARNLKEDLVMYSQASNKFFWLHSANGEVTNLENEKLKIMYKPTFVFKGVIVDGMIVDPTVVYRNFGFGPHDGYDPHTWNNADEWREIECKASGKSDQCGGINHEPEMIGVRGWCHCWDKEIPNVGRLITVGIDDKNSGKYRYRICTGCGKCFSKNEKGDGRNEASIFDKRIEKKYWKESGYSIPTQMYEAMLRAAEEELLSIPDGQIVIHGNCDCKAPCPFTVGFQTDVEEFWICGECGRVYLPIDCAVPMNFERLEVFK